MSNIFLKETNEFFVVNVYTIGYADKGESIYFSVESDKKDFFYDILIDCYKGEKNETKELLDKLKSNKKLNGVCLTHYHEDHFIGLDEILNRYSKKGTMVLAPDVDCEDSLTEGAKKIREKIAWIVKEGRKNFGTVKKIADSREILNESLCVGDKKYEFGILAISPLSTVTMRNIGRDKEEIEQNDYSITLLITLGDLKFLFTGDIMNNTLSNMDEEVYNINYLKIPHHGSKDSDKIFKKINMDGNTVCVATNYKSSRLPDIEILDKYSDITNEVYVIKDGKDDKFGIIHTRYKLDIRNNELLYETESLYDSSQYSKEQVLNLEHCQ